MGGWPGRGSAAKAARLWPVRREGGQAAGVAGKPTSDGARAGRRAGGGRPVGEARAAREGEPARLGHAGG
jgi:hypothetical protein